MRQFSSGRALVHCFIFTLSTAVYATNALWGHWWLIMLTWICVLPATILAGGVYGFVAAVLGFEAIDDVNEPQDDDTYTLRMWADSDEIVEHSENTIGTYQGTPIYEYIIVNDDDTGEQVKCYFHRTVDLDAKFDPPDNLWFTVLSPGILYVEPEKTVQDITLPS